VWPQVQLAPEQLRLWAAALSLFAIGLPMELPVVLFAVLPVALPPELRGMRML